MLLIGLGAGLLLPTATNSVVGAVPQGDSGVGSASNAVALQVGGALGVAVFGSVLATRYQDRMKVALAVGGAVALVGALLVLVGLPSQVSRSSPGAAAETDDLNRRPGP